MLSHMDRFDEDLQYYQTPYSHLCSLHQCPLQAPFSLTSVGGRTPPRVLPPLTELEQTVHEAQQEAGARVVGGKDDVPVLLQEVQDSEEAQTLGEGLLGLGQAVQDYFIQTAVQCTDGAVPL